MTRVRKILDNKGVSLLEVLTAMAVLLILASVILYMVFSAMDKYTYQTTLNRQYMIVEQIESILGKELRYAEMASITDEDIILYGEGFKSLTTDENGFSIMTTDGEERLFLDDIVIGHSVRLEFNIDQEVDPTLFNKNVLFVTIHLDEGQEWYMEYEFVVKMLNIELDDSKEIEVITGATGEKIIYKLVI